MITMSSNFDYRGLSTDNKDSLFGVKNGSTFLEIDTGKVYIYNQETQTWVEI